MQYCPCDAKGHNEHIIGWHAHRLVGSTMTGFAADLRARLPIVELNHDIEWLEAGRSDSEEIVAIAEHTPAGVQTAMPVKSAPGVIAYTVGSLTLFKAAVRQFDIVQQPVTIAGDERKAYVEAMRTLASILPRNGVVMARAVNCGSAFESLLDDASGPLRSAFRVLPWGNVNWHCKIDWTGRVEAYLASLGADSRRNLKRYSKKLFENTALKAQVQRFQSAEELTQFLKDGVQVSDKTYQKTSLGLGLSSDGPMVQRFRFAAERQCFLGHILYINTTPVAFHYGFVFGETFFVVQMGYDPAFSQHQPGAVLFLHVLQDVERLKLPVKTVDCLPGVTNFKLRTTNRKQAIRNYYLFPRSARGTLIFTVLRVVDAVSRSVKSLAERHAGLGRLGRQLMGRGDSRSHEGAT